MIFQRLGKAPSWNRGFESLPHRHRISDLRFSIFDLASLLLLMGGLNDREPLRYLGRMGVKA